MILSLGVLVDLEWLVNPAMAAASIPLAHTLLRRELDRATANAVILLMAVSPWFLAMSASFMSHTATLALWLAACLLLSKARVARAAQAMLFALSSGLLMGLLFLARPMDGVVVGTLTGLWSLRFLADRKGWGFDNIGNSRAAVRLLDEGLLPENLEEAKACVVAARAAGL